MHTTTAPHTHSTECDGCGRRLTLTIIDADGVLIGDECPSCGYYTTRYLPGQAPN